MADVPLLASQSIDAPLDYVIPGAQEIIPKSITASFDGSGAAGDFVPTLVILAPNGTVLASCPMDTTVTAGESVDVSWFPNVGGGGAGGSGIRFNKDNQGGYLDITTNNTDPLGAGFSLRDKSGGGIFAQTDGAGASIQAFTIGGGNIDIETVNGGNLFLASTGASGGIELASATPGGILLTADTAPGGGITIQTDDGGNGLFFLTKSNDTGGNLTRDEGSGGVKTQVIGDGGYEVQNEGTGGIGINDDGSTGTSISSQGPVNAVAGTTMTLRAQGKATLESFNGVDVIDASSGGIRVQTTAGQISILTAVGQHGILLGGGYPIILNADTNGATNTTTIQMRLDGTTNSFGVINLAANATYFNVRSDGRVSMPLLPTSTAGLAAGDLWNSAGTVKIV